MSGFVAKTRVGVGRWVGVGILYSESEQSEKIQWLDLFFIVHLWLKEKRISHKKDLQVVLYINTVCLKKARLTKACLEVGQF